jgi:hypothetical protein
MINFKVVAWRREKKENEKNNKDRRDKKKTHPGSPTHIAILTCCMT